MAMRRHRIYLKGSWKRGDSVEAVAWSGCRPWQQKFPVVFHDAFLFVVKQPRSSVYDAFLCRFQKALRTPLFRRDLPQPTKVVECNRDIMGM